jgi:hypothetical protein
MRSPVLPPEFRERTQQFLRGDRVPLCHARDRIIPRIKIIEALAQPTFEDRGVCEVALHLVENLSTGIDSGIHGVDAQQVMAEAMDRRAGELVEAAARGFQRRHFRRCRAAPERQCELVRHLPGQYIRDEARDPFAKLAGRELGEGDRGNLTRSCTVCQEDDHASGQQCRLAGTGRGLHKQGRAAIR